MQDLPSQDQAELAFAVRPPCPGHTPAVVHPFKQSLLIGLGISTLPKWKMRFRNVFRVAELMKVLAYLTPACVFFSLTRHCLPGAPALVSEPKTK